MSEVERLWNTLERNDLPAFRRVDEAHPCDLYALVDADGAVGLLLVDDFEPPVQADHDAVAFRVARRGDSRWALSITLRRAELQPLFARLCDDLIEAARGIRPGARAGRMVLDRLGRWRRLLELGRDGLLAGHELRGLVGELLVLADHAIPAHGAAVAVSGWQGPLDAPQDFELPGSLVEVKAVRPGAATVRINSIAQLDVVGVRLVLAVLPLAQARADEPGAFTPAALVGRLRREIEAEAAARLEFESRLAAAGWNDHSAYERIQFRAGGARFHEVADGFPRLRRADLPAGVTDAAYDVDLVACEPFITTFDERTADGA